MNYQHRISKEEGEPFIDVVKGYALQRNSISLTASVLQIDRRTLTRYARRHNIHFVAQGEQREGCKQNGGKGKVRIMTRLPMLFNGIIYWPSDPTCCMLYELYDKNERREFISAAKNALKQGGNNA